MRHALFVSISGGLHLMTDNNKYRYRTHLSFFFLPTNYKLYNFNRRLFIIDFQLLRDTRISIASYSWNWMAFVVSLSSILELWMASLQFWRLDVILFSKTFRLQLGVKK